VLFQCCWVCLCSVGSQQSASLTAGLPPQSAGRLPPPASTAQLPAPAQFPSGVSTGPPRGIPPPSVGPMHQMPPVPGGFGQRPAGVMPPRPPSGQQLPTSVSIYSPVPLCIFGNYKSSDLFHWTGILCHCLKMMRVISHPVMSFVSLMSLLGSGWQGRTFPTWCFFHCISL